MNKDIFNASPTSPVAVHSDALKPRFSNAQPWTTEYVSDDYSDINAQSGSGLGKDTNGSGLLKFFGGLANTLGSVATSIWGTSDRYTATAYQNMYNQEKRTTNLLIGIVVALVLLAFVFLIIKKNK